MDKEKFDVLHIGKNKIREDSSYSFSNDPDQIIYRVDKIRKKQNLNSEEETEKTEQECFQIQTGFYIGCLVIGEQKLLIKCGYDDSFLQRLLKYSNKVYINSSSKYEQSADNYDVFNILEYMFLSSLKSVLSLGIPKKYKTEIERSWNIKGNINWNKYFAKDMYDKKGVTFSFRQHDYDAKLGQIILYAIKLCNRKYINDCFKEIVAFKDELINYCPSSKPSETMLNDVLNSNSLLNGLYAKYKKVIWYAEMIIRHKSLMPDSNTGKKAVGWIINITELWEDYLSSIIHESFSDWRIITQKRLPLYSGTFYERDNYPDILMEKDGHLIILDAKYKKMDFTSGDVDRADLHQIQSYYGYFMASGLYTIDYVALVYPARNDPKKDNTSTSIYGLESVQTKFDIAYVKIGNNELEQLHYENEFIERLKSAILN